MAVDALLTRVFSLASHPDQNKRLGGLMAFNQLCKPLREEDSLIDRQVMFVLFVLLAGRVRSTFVPHTDGAWHFEVTTEYQRMYFIVFHVQLTSFFRKEKCF